MAVLRKLVATMACITSFGAFACGAGNDPRPAAGGNGGSPTTSGGGEGGTTTSTGAMATPCGEQPPPTVLGCPLACTGGCSDDLDLCIIACSEEQDCNDVVSCPAGMSCQVTCTGIKSCRYQVRCNDDYKCNVTCNGDDACKGLTMFCGERGECTLTCAVAFETCLGAVVECGKGKCQSLCFGTEKPELKCGDACSCMDCIN